MGGDGMSAATVKTDPSTTPVEWVRREMSLPGQTGVMSYLVCDHAGPDAPWVIFSHANSFHGGTYRKAFEHVAARSRVILLDLRGHGATTLSADPKSLFSWHAYARDLHDFLDVLGERDYVLAGHSLGAVVSFLVGQRRPSQVRGLLMMEPVLMRRSVSKILSWGRPFGLMQRVLPLIRYAEQRKTHFQSRDAAFDNYRGRGVFRTWPDDVLRDYVEEGFHDTPDGRVTLACHRDWEVATYLAQENHIWKHARAAQFPITVLTAERHSTMLPAMARRLTKRLPQSRVDIVPGTTHTLPMERPDAVAKAVESLSDAASPA